MYANTDSEDQWTLVTRRRGRTYYRPMPEQNPHWEQAPRPQVRDAERRPRDVGRDYGGEASTGRAPFSRPTRPRRVEHVPFSAHPTRRHYAGGKRKRRDEGNRLRYLPHAEAERGDHGRGESYERSYGRSPPRSSRPLRRVKYPDPHPRYRPRPDVVEYGSPDSREEPRRQRPSYASAVRRGRGDGEPRGRPRGRSPPRPLMRTRRAEYPAPRPQYRPRPDVDRRRSDYYERRHEPTHRGAESPYDSYYSEEEPQREARPRPQRPSGSGKGRKFGRKKPARQPEPQPNRRPQGQRGTTQTDSVPQSDDPDFKIKVRSIYNIIKLTHHRNNVLCAEMPARINQITAHLCNVIKPASPKKDTQELFEGNARNWAYNTMLILRSHYEDSLQIELAKLASLNAPHAWTDPWVIALKWARRSLGTRLLTETLDEVEGSLHTHLRAPQVAAPPGGTSGRQRTPTGAPQVATSPGGTTGSQRTPTGTTQVRASPTGISMSQRTPTEDPQPSTSRPKEQRRPRPRRDVIPQTSQQREEEPYDADADEDAGEYSGDTDSTISSEDAAEQVLCVDEDDDYDFLYQVPPPPAPVLLPKMRQDTRSSPKPSPTRVAGHSSPPVQISATTVPETQVEDVGETTSLPLEGDAEEDQDAIIPVIAGTGTTTVETETDISAAAPPTTTHSPQTSPTAREILDLTSPQKRVTRLQRATQSLLQVTQSQERTPTQERSPRRVATIERPTRHICTMRKMADWWLTVSRRWLIIGDSNLSRIPSFKNSNLQIDSFPGATFRHGEQIISKATVSTPVNRLILSFGINHRSQATLITPIKELQGILRAARSKFPSADIWVPEINFSPNLPLQEKQQLASLNQHIVKNVNYLPALLPEEFNTMPDNVHWTSETAVTMLQHWCQCLN